MKKKILLLPLLSLALCGCSFEDLMFWKTKDQDTDQKESEKQNEEKETTPETPVTPGETENLKNPFTTTINFYGDSLPNEWTAPGVSMDSTLLSCQTQNERLNNLTNAQLEKSGLLTELFFTKINTAWYDSSDLVIQIGTGNPSKDSFNSGTFIWTSSKKIYKVDVTAQCYTKPEGTTDVDAHLQIDAGAKGTDKNYDRPINNKVTNDMSFAVGTDETPTYKSYSNTYPKGIDRFCLTSLEGRVLLKSLTITWDL